MQEHETASVFTFPPIAINSVQGMFAYRAEERITNIEQLCFLL